MTAWTCRHGTPIRRGMRAGENDNARIACLTKFGRCRTLAAFMNLTQSNHGTWPLPNAKRGGVVRMDGMIRASGGL